MKFNKTIWEVLALLPWMVIFSAVAVHIALGLPPVVSLSLFGLITYALIAATLFVIWILFTIHAWKNGRIEWALIIFFFSIFSYPVYWWKYIRHPMPKYTDAMFAGEIGELQKELTELALRIAKESYGINLNFTHKSINVVEGILSDIHEIYKETGNTDGLNGIALEFGSYIAATIQKNTDTGVLAKNDPDIGDGTFPFYWKESVIFTYAWCEKRIFDGEGDDIVSKYRVLVLDKI